jgi:hypothetical protein
MIVVASFLPHFNYKIIFTDKPICSNLHRVVQGVGRDRVSKIVCPIDAHPPPLDYAWTFNSSLETHTVSQAF